MSKEKQIEEMASVLENAKIDALATVGSMNNGFGMWYAQALYNAGCRKQSEGEWIELKRFYASGKNLIHYQCNLCGVYLAKQANFCPNCGARMKGGAE